MFHQVKGERQWRVARSDNGHISTWNKGKYRLIIDGPLQL